MAQTEIAWTDTCWNVVKGCKRVSPGCGGGPKGPDGGQGGCYAETMAARLVRMGGYEWGKFENDGWQEDPQKKWSPASRATADKYKDLVRINKHGKPQWTGVFAFDVEKLREPLSWRARRLVFANSMSDLFGEGLTNEQIAAVFAVMAASTSTFQLLTKRAERMLKWFRWFKRESDRSGLTCFGFLASHAHALGVPAATEPLLQPAYGGETWPLPNVWLGVSCERQEEADERIPLLLKCPAAVRWVSAEPLLGPIDLERTGALGCSCADPDRCSGTCPFYRNAVDKDRRIDWIVWGGESGTAARPCDARWIRAGVTQCRSAGVAAFVKQLGAFSLARDTAISLKDKKGADPSEWPEDLRVREWPHGFVPPPKPKKKSLPVVGGGQ